MNSRLLNSALLDEEQLAHLVTKTDLAQAERFGSVHRRREFLSWRALLYSHLGGDIHIDYDNAGGPIITNRPLHIGVSHSCDRVAVIVADEPCAVDIERLDRNFAGVAHKYLTDEERTLCPTSRELAAAWAAKECLYKYGRRNISLRDQISLHTIDLTTGEIVGSIEQGEPILLCALIEKGYITVYIG